MDTAIGTVQQREAVARAQWEAREAQGQRELQALRETLAKEVSE